MGNCCKGVKGSRDEKEPYQFEPNWEGPVKRRSCTDIICIFLFLAALGAWGFVAYLSFSSGDINKLIHPTDSQGKICGSDGPLKDRKNLLFFDLTQCLNPAVLTLGCPTPQVCVEKCPTKTLSFSKTNILNVFQGKVPAEIKPFCTKDTDFTKDFTELINSENCPPYVLKSKPFLGRCVPDIGGEESNNKTISKDENIAEKELTVKNIQDARRRIVTFISARDFLNNAVTDLYDTYWMIGIGLILAFLLCMLWVFLMRFIAGFLIWTSILILFVLFAGLFGYSVYRCDQVYKSGDKNADDSIFQVNYTPDFFVDVLKLKDTWLAFSIITGIFTLIIILIFIALRKRIQLAIALLDQGAKAVGKNCGSIFWPVVPFILHLVVFAWFALLSMYITSSGVNNYKVVNVNDNATCTNTCPDNPATNKSYSEGDICKPDSFECKDCPDMMCRFVYEKNFFGDWKAWYNLFAFFWTMEFITALGEFVLAGTFSQWYWTHNKSDLPCCTVFSNIGKAFFHIGTIAFGSLIIGIIRFIQAILNRIEKTLKKYNNDLTKCLLCCCKCCLWCLEKFMRFINRNAYIMCAMKSTNFCVSAKDAFSLLMRNMVRVVVLNNVVWWLLWFGKLMIVVGVGTLSGFFFASQIPIPELEGQIPTLNHAWLPTFLIIVGSYYIATSFFNVYAMAVDTLFLCLMEDLERNDGTPEKPYFAPKKLREVVGKMQKFNERHNNQHDEHENIPLNG